MKLLKLKYRLILIIGLISFTALAQQNNPAGKNFNFTASDAKAIEIADEVMQAQGGRKAWDESRFVSWTFFGARKHIWDKYTGDVRIEAPRTGLKIVMNINSGLGRVFANGMEQTHPDSLAKYLKIGKEAWINDSYWLFMPFKLKDDGVTLKYLGEETMVNGKQADVLQMTFEDVGVTPENGYKIYVDKNTKLVSQWAFFRTASLAEPNFITTWEDYQTYGNIKLSGKRGWVNGQDRFLSDISVSDTIDPKLLKEF